jgi:hypothetical protein
MALFLYFLTPSGKLRTMVDTISILLTHGLLVIALWRLAHSDEVDAEAPPEPDENPTGFFHETLRNKREN